MPQRLVVPVRRFQMVRPSGMTSNASVLGSPGTTVVVSNDGASSGRASNALTGSVLGGAGVDGWWLQMMVRHPDEPPMH
jgi:hypothetical protein